MIFAFWGAWRRHNLCKGKCRVPGYFGRLCIGSSKLSGLPGGNSFPPRALKAAENTPSPACSFPP